MNSLQDLKNDIEKTKTVVREEQLNLEERIKNGLFSNEDDVLDNNTDYYEDALKTLETDRKTNDNSPYEILDDNIEQLTEQKEPTIVKTQKKKTILQKLITLFK